MSHPLDGPRFKVRRAKAQIAQLRQADQEFRRRAQYEIVLAEFDPIEEQHLYRLHVGYAPELGLEWGTSIGEIAHNLRSALDNLTWQLALVNCTAPSPRTEFPIFLDVSTFEKEGRSRLRDLSPGAATMIEQLQPYQPGRHGAADPLWDLRAINNADKHRLIQVVAASAGAVTYGAWADDTRVDTTRLFDMELPLLEEGALMFRSAEPVAVAPTVKPFIVFAEGCPEVQRRGVCYRLDVITDTVFGIVENFATAFP